MGGWAGFLEESEARGFAAWADALACRLYPYRVTLCTAGLASFLVGALPLVLVAHQRVDFAPWHGAAFAASVPLVLWALCLALHATFFEPTRGLVETLCRARVATPPWVRRALRVWATATVAAFAVAPIGVLLVAAVA